MTSNSKRHFRKTLLTTAMLSAFALPALAQDEPTASSEEVVESTRTLQAVTVTAQKREQNANDVGITLNTFSGDELLEQGFDDPEDLALLVPGVSFAESGLNTPIYTIRGVGLNETSLAASSTVAISVDEVAFPFPATTRGATVDVQRVEVAKGPQGTLFGLNTTAGSINFVSNKPTDELDIGVFGEVGRFNAVQVGGHISGPVLGDKVRARIAGRFDTADGFQISQTRPDDRNGDVSTAAGRFTLDVDPAENVRLSFSFNGWTDSSDTQAPQLVAFDFINPLNVNPALANSPLAPPGDIRAADFDADFPLFRDDNFWQISARGEWDITDNITAISITSYSDYNTEAGNEFDGTAEEVFSFVTGGDIQSVSTELRFEGDFANRIQWVVGGNYSFSDTLDTNSLLTGGTSANFTGITTLGTQGTGTGVLSAENFADQELQTWSIFASAETQIFDSLSLTTGVRYTDFQADFLGCAGDTGDNTLSSVIQGASNFFRGNEGLDLLPDSAFIPGVFDNGVCTTFTDPGDDPTAIFTPGFIEDTLNEDNVSWRVALNYTPIENVLFYGSISQGFKNGTFPTIPSTSFEQYVPATEEDLLAYELGVKATLLDNTLQFNSAAFYYDYTDKQQRGFFVDPIFGALSQLVNIPESEVYGLEFDVVWLPVEGLTLSAGALFLETNIEEFVGASPSDIIGDPQTDFAGGELSFAPDINLNFSAKYERDTGFGDTRAFIGGDYIYRGDTTANVGFDPNLDIPSYGVLNLRAGIAAGDGSWQVTAFGENVTNEFFFNNLVPQFDTIKGFTGAPVTYGLRFKKDF